MLFFQLIQLKDDDQVIGNSFSHHHQFLTNSNATSSNTTNGTYQADPSGVAMSGVNVIRKTPKNKNQQHVGSSTNIIPLVTIFSQTLDSGEELYQRILVFLPYSSAITFSCVSKHFYQLAKKHSPYIFSMNQFIQWYHQVCVLMLSSNTETITADILKRKQHNFLRSVQVISRSCRIQLLLNELFHKATIPNIEEQKDKPDIPPVGIFMCIPLSSRVEFTKKHKMVRQLIDTISLQNVYYQEMCTFLLGKLQIIEFEQIKGEENYGFCSVIQLIPDLQQLDQKVFIHQNLMATTLQNQQQKKRVTLYQMSIGTNSTKYGTFLGLSGDLANNERQIIVNMAGSKYEFNDIILYKLCQLSGVITNTTSMSVTEMFQFLAMCGTLDTCQSVIEQYYNYKRNNLQTFPSSIQKCQVTTRETTEEFRSVDFVSSTFLKQYVFELTNIKSTKIYLLDLLINMTNQLLCDIQLLELPIRLINYHQNSQEYERIIRNVSNVFGREVRFKLLGSSVESTNYSIVRMNVIPTVSNKLLTGSNKSTFELVFNFMGFTSLKYVGAENLRLTIRTSNKRLASLLGIKEERDVLILNNQIVNLRILKNLTQILEIGWSESELLFFLLTIANCTSKAFFTEASKTAYIENEWTTIQKEQSSLHHIAEHISKILQTPSLINTEVI